MRKTLIAAAVATALFAVGAFAASFTTQAEDVASGADSVVACAANVDITFDQPTFVGGQWVVTSATATFFDSVATSPSAACDAFDAQLAITSDGAVTTYADTTISGGVATFALSNLPVGAIDEAAVAVDGAFITSV